MMSLQIFCRPPPLSGLFPAPARPHSAARDVWVKADGVSPGLTVKSGSGRVHGGAAIRIERILNLELILFYGKRNPCRHCTILGALTVMAGLVPAIHVVQWRRSFRYSRRPIAQAFGLRASQTTWMAGTSPAMTENGMESRTLPVCFSLAHRSNPALRCRPLPYWITVTRPKLFRSFPPRSPRRNRRLSQRSGVRAGEYERLRQHVSYPRKRVSSLGATSRQRNSRTKRLRIVRRGRGAEGERSHCLPRARRDA